MKKRVKYFLSVCVLQLTSVLISVLSMTALLVFVLTLPSILASNHEADLYSESALASSGMSMEAVGPMAKSIENEAFTSATTEAGRQSCYPKLSCWLYNFYAGFKM